MASLSCLVNQFLVCKATILSCFKGCTWTQCVSGDVWRSVPQKSSIVWRIWSLVTKVKRGIFYFWLQCLHTHTHLKYSLELVPVVCCQDASWQQMKTNRFYCQLRERTVCLFHYLNCSQTTRRITQSIFIVPVFQFYRVLITAIIEIVSQQQLRQCNLSYMVL